MISWRDEALILHYQRHGEANAVLDVFTQAHGRYRGLVRGGGARKNAPVLQAGGVASVEFSARLEAHLGTFKVEPVKSFVTQIINDPLRLAAFQSLCALTKFSMEERDPHPRLYQAATTWMEAENYLWAYLQWELILLSEIGLELELTRCAVTGASEDLAFVSPKTGRAVARGAAGEWADRLLPYSPAFQSEDASAAEIAQALHVTEYFLTEWLAKMIGKARLPEARERLAERLATK